MQLLLAGIDIVLDIYCWILFVWMVLQALGGFKVIDIRNRRVAVINRYLDRATVYPLWPFRKIMPDLGEIDLSPIPLVLALMTVRYALALNAWPKFQ